RIVFSPDGRRLVAQVQELAAGRTTMTLRLWDASSRKELRKVLPRAGETWLNAPTFSPDGKILAWVSPDGTVSLTDAVSGKELGQCNGEGRTWFTFSPDSKALITRTVGGGAVTVWEVSSGRALRRFSPTTGHLPNSLISLCEPGMAVSPDGKTLAASGD